MINSVIKGAASDVGPVDLHEENHSIRVVLVVADGFGPAVRATQYAGPLAVIKASQSPQWSSGCADREVSPPRRPHQCQTDRHRTRYGTSITTAV